MPSLLRIDASSRLEGSHSRDMGDQFVQQWTSSHPGAEVITRDLIATPIPHVSEATIMGFFSPPEQLDDAGKVATALSDELIGELKAAETILITTPMYNFSLPSSLKAWIDHVSRINHTFSFSPEEGFAGLIENKDVYVITSCGAVFAGGLQAMDFLSTYLKAMLEFLGLTNPTFLPIEGTSGDDETLARTQAACVNAIKNFWS